MKTENKVSLEQVLWSREKRVATQKELLEKYPGTLICFMLNIPGPEKVNKLFEKVFYEGLEKIQNKLETEKISTEVRLVQENITGYEGYLVVKADGCRVKKLMIALEETKIGRLYDIDVLEKEKEIAADKARQEGKPENMIEKIAMGRIGKFYKEVCLLKQEYIQDGKMTVAEYLKSVDKDLTVTAFKRFTLRAE